MPSGDEQAASRDGGRWNLAITNARRRFHLDRRQHRGAYIDQDVVLAYGKTYNGWTILPTSDGTRFANDRTGHGMFVSIEALSVGSIAVLAGLVLGGAAYLLIAAALGP